MWPFKKKEQPKYVLTRDYKGKYHTHVNTNTNDRHFGSDSIIAESEDECLIRGLFASLSQQIDLAEEIKKHITDSMPKGYVDRIIIGGDHTFINKNMITSTIPTVEDIKNMIEDPNIFYVVQGEFPHIMISKYTKVEEDSFNYCLRSECGNLSLLSKTICFNSKADAVLYQNKLIQEAIENQKSKKK